MIRLKRVYERADKNDGLRVLVDRLWPRGLSREKAGVDLWLKDAAPSDGLRKWFSHDREKWPEFRRKYFRELEKNKGSLGPLKGAAGKKLTLLYAAKDEECNNAVVLKEFINQKGGTNGGQEGKGEESKGFLKSEKRLPA